ncbi:Uncharacterised protein [uncultured archaeon]|nr:Uncharacterised protein [uncultured archaeon]
MSTPTKNPHDEYREIGASIKQLQDLRKENAETIKKLQKNNQEIDGTIAQLKEKQRKLLFLTIHFKDDKVNLPTNP